MAAHRSNAARADVDRSFEELYRGHHADVFRAALRELGNVHDAEDVTQAAFVDAYRAVLRGSEPQSPRAWLLAIAENVRRRRYRTAARRPREEPVDADFPLTAELPHELARSLAEALHDLPQEQRAAFVLREIGGLSYEEIAKETGSTVGAVQMQLFRARRTLRGRLEPPTVSRRRAGLLALPGWATSLVSRADLALLTPRAAGAVGAAAVAVAGASVTALEAGPGGASPIAEPRPAAVSDTRAADPGAAPGSHRSETSTAVRIVSRSAPVPVRPAAAVRRAPAQKAKTPMATPAPAAPASVVVQEPSRSSAAPRALPAPSEPIRAAATAVRGTVTRVEGVLELPRLPDGVPIEKAEAVLEQPVVPPLPTAPVSEVVTGAARAAGGGAQPLPVTGVPPVTVPLAP